MLVVASRSDLRVYPSQYETGFQCFGTILDGHIAGCDIVRLYTSLAVHVVTFGYLVEVSAAILSLKSSGILECRSPPQPLQRNY